MGKRRRLIPFGIWPGHWGLSGDTRTRARIEYEYDGVDVRIKLLELEDDTKENKKKILNLKESAGYLTKVEYQEAIIDIETADDPKANQLAKLQLDYDRGIIAAHQYELKKAEIEFGIKSNEYRIALLQQQFDVGEIGEFEFQKKVANVLDEPWIRVVSSDYEPNDGIDGFSFQLDYNQAFVKYLHQHGYTGLIDDEVVEQWFNDVSKSELQAEIEASDFTLPKTSIQTEDANTVDGKAVKKYS